MGILSPEILRCWYRSKTGLKETRAYAGEMSGFTIYIYISKPRGQEKINPLAILFGMRVLFSLGPCTGLKLQCFLIVLMSFYAVFVQLGKFPVTGCCACTQMNSKRPLEPKCLDVEFWAIRFRFKMPTVQNLGPTSTVQPVRFLIGTRPKEHIEDH